MMESYVYDFTDAEDMERYNLNFTSIISLL